jgi:hypothetical protein
MNNHKHQEKLAQKLVRVAAKPEEGAYYWIPSPEGHWSLMPYYSSVYGEDVTHSDLWERSTSNLIAESWGLKEPDRSELSRHPYGLPRGRVSKGSSSFFLNHGGDSPVDPAILLRKVSSEFNLQAYLAKDKVKLLADNHEKMVREDYAAVSRILDLNRRLTANLA